MATRLAPLLKQYCPDEDKPERFNRFLMKHTLDEVAFLYNWLMDYHLSGSVDNFQEAIVGCLIEVPPSR
jgi:hypothetical protein